MIFPEFASYWAQKLGNSEESLVQLRGGINNLVYRFGIHDRYCVIKGYPIQQANQRDRMQAEVEFLNYAQRVAKGRVPELINVDFDRRCVVMEYISGSSFPEAAKPLAEHVSEAESFFRQLNSDMKLARQMIHLDAAEGFLSLKQHIGCVWKRLALMGTNHLHTAFRSQARDVLILLEQQIHQAEERLEAGIATGEYEDLLDPKLRCVSPSDFGFHNSIRTTNGLRFIDFEFAGWDDPAKAIADFDLQPRNNTPKEFSPLLNTICVNHFEDVRKRVRALKPILRLKWICIILAVLRYDRYKQMLAIHRSTPKAKLVSVRLEQARQMLIT